MNKFLEEAQAMLDEIIANRRHIHQNAECGLNLPLTVAFVQETLASYGIESKELGGGVTCTIGQGEPVFMVRADMDALPQDEISGVDFACTDRKACHSCGHDCHTAQLLAAAKILKAHESELKGTIKFMFQPGEETLLGSIQMVEAGILENPKVDAAMGLHMSFGPCGYDSNAGVIGYAPAMASADAFEITITGVATHGSTPHLGCSPINVAGNIIVAIQQLMTLEISADEPTVVAFGQIHGGVAPNAIPEQVVLAGNIRTFSFDNRAKLKKRIVEIAESVAATWGAQVKVEYTMGVGPTVNDKELSAELAEYCSEVANKVVEVPPIKGSEDFSYVSEHVPSFFAFVGAGSPDEGYLYSMHNPRMTIDESALAYGAATYCNCAVRWLENHSK